MAESYPFFLAGRWVDKEEKIQVRSPWDGSLAAQVARAGEEDLEEAAAQAEAAFECTRLSAPWEREKILRAAADRLEERAQEFARVLVMEAGKPIRFARAEVARAVHTLRLSAAQAWRLQGKVIPIDTAPWGKGKIGFVKYVPAGPVAAISPFNFPLNLSLHKIGPALAAGNPVVLKPASATPVTACKIASLFEEAGLHPGWLSVVPCDRRLGERLVEDDRFRVLSFTGSPAAGWEIRRKAGRKKIALELGGNAAVVLHEDADLDRAIPKIVTAAFGFAGQSCISVQRILIHREIYGRVRESLLAATAAARAGDPMEEETLAGPLITGAAADRVMDWIGRARSAGARLLCGGKREGNVIQPTLLEDVPREAEVDRLEVFGPVAVLHAYEDFEEALAQVNDSIYGLQAGVFTRDVGRILEAWRDLEVGGLVVNDVPTFRVDSMPYGGVKESGMGREGPEWAMEHMTEPRLLVLHQPE